ncbi:unnamed protein product (macronuclear) [Paramecium tetraurelia]|uniref:40S ribosomal protein S15a n=1 Tax=Paramecium tetraurelia TaxID=5888 RepID=A0BVU5_PARTE|nr:uncharacterized protein GSPATT00032514001 [Paramecium tetraurelia]CAK62662.1 unnamed protein product [Paramecium tetraurelia]|eukprot:XP_001430060.1 hypothetical protein (macronuclear) [Paramecium tetraurelia strain d4-2]
MVKMNVLNDCLRSIVNAERQGRKQVLIRPTSKLVVKFLQVMQRHGYIGEFEIVRMITEVAKQLLNYQVVSTNAEWANNILPARQFGCVVLTTNVGILTHEEARQRHIGGKILGFFY